MEMSNPNLPIAGNYNTYIGARYVPLIMGIWSETVAYEPLSIVTYHGDSYTSKTFVPAGTPVNNETYWALTGNYNSQVEQYRQETQALQSTVNTNSAAIQVLQKQSNRKYLFMGDSYIANDANNFVAQVAERFGWNENNYSVLARNGCGFTISNNTPSDLLNTWLTMNSLDTYTDVIMCYGANDTAGNQETILQGITNAVNIIRNNNPNINIHLGMNGMVYFYAPQIYSVSVNYKMAANSLNLIWIPNFSSPLLFNNLGSDHIHPTSNGQKALADYLYHYLINNNYTHYDYYQLTSNDFNFIDGVSLTYINVNLTLINNSIVCEIQGYGTQIPNIQGNVKIATIKNISLYSNFTNTLGYINGTPESKIIEPLIVSFSNGELIFTSNGIDGTIPLFNFSCKQVFVNIPV